MASKYLGCVLQFRVALGREDDLGEESNIPALSLWDENAPLDAVFTSVKIFNWSIHSGIDLKIQDVNDKCQLESS